ncbi:hypothetical protein BofuT4_P017760.1 [Botrytis cinerea T4]|uniref:Uncharacterized protein n=1 Tax=Botryotinia fuckeliana (strain T4) TaxID=999810 RepID=G2YID3_BOTF4|nr:hypothetical protein BofuT4_P017760.1 [Botrytis cinerea T4]
MICADSPCSSFFLPPSFSSHPEYLFSTEGSTFHFDTSGVESLFLCSRAARIGATERRVSSGPVVNLNSDASMLEETRNNEPEIKPMITADPKNMMMV